MPGALKLILALGSELGVRAVAGATLLLASWTARATKTSLKRSVRREPPFA